MLSVCSYCENKLYNHSWVNHITKDNHGFFSTGRIAPMHAMFRKCAIAEVYVCNSSAQTCLCSVMVF